MADGTLSERLTVEIAADLSPMTQGLSQAGRQLSEFANGSVGQATRSMTRAFEGTFSAFERSVMRATKTGSLSIRDMVTSIIADLSRIAIRQSITSPLTSLLRGIAGSAVGAIQGRANGGPVAPNGAYVVGERGPEIFVPAGNGNIVPGAPLRARPQIIVNIQVRDAQSFLKSESQVAAMMARALGRGQRNL